MTTNSIDLAIVAGSLVVVVAVGLWASRNQGKSARAYFLASGNLPWWIIGAAFVSTSVSSEQIVGTVGFAYTAGMGAANWEWFALPQYTLLMVFFIPLYLKNRIMTIPDLLAQRYGPVCGNVYSWAMLFAYIFIFMVPVLYGGTLVLSKWTGFNFYIVLWVMVSLVALYTVKGGLAAVVWTDAVQCVMLLGGGLVLYFVALSQIDGGWSAMVEANPERFHLYHPADDEHSPFLGLVAGTLGIFIWYQGCNQVMIQRVLGARSTWDGLMGIVFAGFINLVRPLVTCFLGFVVYHWIFVMERAEPLERADLTFPFALDTFAPEWGLRGIVLTGFLAAVMSTLSALSNSTATIFSLDVYKKLIRPDADDHRVVRTGRIAALIALASSALVSPVVERAGGIFQYFQTGVTYLSVPFITVIFFGFFWKRANYQAGIFGVIGGLVITLLVWWGLPVMGIELHWLYNGFIAQVLIAIGMVIVTLCTPPPDPEQVKRFVWSPKMLAEYDEGRKRPFYQRVWVWWALYGVIWIYLYWKFW